MRFTLILLTLLGSSLFADTGSIIKTEKIRGNKDSTSSVCTLEARPDGAKRLRIPMSEIKKGAKITLGSNNWNAEKGEEGWYLYPTGALLRFTNTNGTISGRFNPISMFGVKTPRTCTLAILKSLYYECNLVCNVKDGKYELKLIANLKYPAYEDLVIDFYDFPPEASYSDMGRKYRQWQIDERGVVPLRERAKKRPALAKSAENMLLRFQHGCKPFMEVQTPENEPDPKIFITFEQAAEALKKLKATGVESLDVHTVGWNKGGHDGRYPQLFPVEPLFGGEEKLRELINTAQKLGYQITCHTNYNDAYKIADCWTEDLILRKADGSMRTGAIYGGGRVYLCCPTQVMKLLLNKDMDAIKKLGFKGIHHIDVITCAFLHPCFSKEHPLNMKESLEAWGEIMRRCGEKFDGFSSESGADFAIKYLDFAYYISAYPKYYPSKNDLISELVPIWQIIYHGIVLSNPFRLTSEANFEKKDKTPMFADKTSRVLKLVEFGGRPCYYVRSMNDKSINSIKQMYDMYQALKYLQYEFMDEHKALAPSVYLTRYSDGSETVVNYSGDKFPYRGRVVNPQSFELFKPANNSAN